ncbi:phasin family protein [Actibacterium sp. D379-3]
MANTPTPKLGDPGAFSGMQTEGLALLGGFGTAMMEAMGRSGAEVMEFVGNRLKEDMKLQQELMNCRDMNKIGEIQAQFMKTAMAQYSAESGKIMQISTDAFEKIMNRTKG